MLAFACKVHKIQGLRLPSIAVSSSLNKQKTFSYGQRHVALSRVKSLGHLYIDCFKSLGFLKENNMLHSILQYNSKHYLQNLLYNFFKDLRFIEVIILMSKTS